jgi:FKBP-type peptidyl-prolyl cis-trans isomerase FkpA
MKRILLAICCAGILIYINSCYKSYDPGYSSGCTPAPVDKDSTALLKFAWYHMITTTKDNSGLYYEITNSASGAGPSGTSTVYVTYVGKLMDGTTFDSVGNAEKTGWLLNTLLEGWQIGLPKICAGGHIKLLIPSGLGFGCAGTRDGSVPPDAPVFYDITLVRFYN